MIRPPSSPPSPALGSSRRRAGQRGQSLVEVALLLPVLIVIVLATVDLGRVYLGFVSLNNIARIGANFAAQNPDAWRGTGNSAQQARYRQLMGRDADGINCVLPNPLPAPTFLDPAPNSYNIGSRVKVTLNCTFQLFTPLLSSIIGDGAGNLPVSTSATFVIRFGSPDLGPVAGGGTPATPSPAPTPSPTPSDDDDPSESEPPASATPVPPEVTFYGTPTSVDSYGGGPTGSPGESQIVGIPNLSVTFSNTTSGTRSACLWNFGDGSVSTSCSNSVSHSYTSRATYEVSLTVDGGVLVRPSYVLVGCKVPAFAGVRVNNASSDWVAAGFSAGNLTTQSGVGNYKIGYQSLAGGLVNPPGGCSDASVVVGP